MSGRIFRFWAALAAALLLSCFRASADDGTFSSYSPYSIFGIGDLLMPGTAYNHSMGGVGIASRNRKFINPLNPASITARDSLAFMADFSVHGENKYFRQGDIFSANNVFNVNDCIISFPIWRSSAMMIGVAPYSGTGFGYSTEVTDPSIIGKTGSITYEATGTGGLYQVFLGAGVTFWKRLSIGAEAKYLFGNTIKKYYQTFSDPSYSGASFYYDMMLNSLAGKFGLQYEQPIGKAKLCIGATYTIGSDINGFVDKYKLSTSTAASDTLYYVSDTLSKRSDKIRLASEKGIGISLRYNDTWMIEFDYTRSNWRNSGFENADGFSGNRSTISGKSIFSTTVSESFRIGFEIVPNRNDIRYYMKTCAYRAGAYYKRDYFKLDGRNIDAYGITLGVTFPVFRWHNGLTAAIDVGSRGNVANNLIRETYVNFSVGINIFDIWFQKPRYE